MVTVAVDDVRPTTEAGLRVTDTRNAGLIESVADCDTDPTEPVIVALTWLATAVVLAVNDPTDLPAAISTVTGTIADFELLANFTVTPPVGAGPVKVIVPDEGLPPTTNLGDRVTEAMVGAVTVTVALSVTEPKVA